MSPIPSNPSDSDRSSRVPSGPGASRGALPRTDGRRLLTAVALLGLTLMAGWAVGNVRLSSAAGAADVFRARAAGPVHFSGRLDRSSVLQGSDGRLGMELQLSAEAPDVRRAPRVASDLVVVLDRSGSMSGKPLADARGAVRDLIARLGPDDRFALVVYASGAETLIPLQAASPAQRARFFEIVDGIGPGGGTDMASGIDLALATIAGGRERGRMPRVILLSDGHANEGDHSFEGLRARATRAVTGEYALSTVGVGDGFDEVLMTGLADAGTGNFYYVRDGRDLGDVFAGEFESARETVASALRVEMELAPGVELLDAAGYPLEREGRIVRFRPGSLFAGQERRIWLQLRAPTDRTGDRALGELRLAYRSPQAEPGSPPVVLRLDETPRVACVQDVERYRASLDEGLVLRNLAEDRFSALEQRVAAAVRSGDYVAARRAIGDFKGESARLLRDVGQAPEESDSHERAEALEEELRSAFASPQAPAARNALSKQLSASGQDGRRPGAKKQ